MTRGGKLAVTGAALAALLAVVATASRAHHPGGGNGGAPSHPPLLLAEYAARLLGVLAPDREHCGVRGVASWTLLRRRLEGDEWYREAQLMAALDEVLADTLDDLRAETDPRKAVIRTYARMERTFAAYGVPREEAETPLEYVERVLAQLSLSSFAINRITQLFARAKFSPHEIDAAMKDEAIEALVGLRAELEYKPEAA